LLKLSKTGILLKRKKEERNERRKERKKETDKPVLL